MASLDYSSQLDNLKKAQRNAAVADLQNTRNQALSNLTAEQQQNAANYATQRNTANAQNRLSARNFQEYLASTGRANSGLAAQASLQHGNNLNTAMNSIYGAENATNADILRRRTDAQNAYNSGLAAANANIEANYIQALMNEKDKAFNRQLQEKQYQENVRQFNENLKLQKEQLRKSFSSGSGGGSRYSGGGSGGSGKDSPQIKSGITTAFYSGDLNKDAKNGTFSNGYQPNNVNGQKLQKTGQTIKVKTQTLQGTNVTVKQNVWKTSDGTKYIWDGRQNKYVKVK